MNEIQIHAIGLHAAVNGLALSRRSFTLWLVALVLLVIALWVAFFFRDPEPRVADDRVYGGLGGLDGAIGQEALRP